MSGRAPTARTHADTCARRRSAPTRAPAISLFSAQYVKMESLTGRGGSAAPRRTLARSGGARPLGPPLSACFRSKNSNRTDSLCELFR